MVSTYREGRHAAQMADFRRFMDSYPDLRFWQGVRGWSGWPFVLVSTVPPHELAVARGDGQVLDTFHWETTRRPSSGPGLNEINQARTRNQPEALRLAERHQAIMAEAERIKRRLEALGTPLLGEED